jgi:hypothetical protein
LWREAAPIGGSIAEAYLRRHRRITVTLPPTLRCHRSIKVPGLHLRLPALIAAASGEDRTVMSVQVTFLDPGTGNKADIDLPRRTFGKLGDAAVRLGPAGPRLGISEGVEDALAALQLTGTTVWASLGVQRLAKIALPSVVKSLIVFADADAVGKEGARRAVESLWRRNLDGELRLPPKGCGDWNDVLIRQGQRHE